LPFLALAILAALLTSCTDGVRGPSSEQTVMVSVQTSEGEIILQLDQQRAPVSVANFLDHAVKGHYEGTIFHRVIPGFVIQGGGWTSDFVERAKTDAAEGSPDRPIKNEWKNGLKNRRGTIAMARESDPDSATREFYINLADNGRLDTSRPQTGNAGYAVFGHVVKGLSVVDRIAAGKIRPAGSGPDVGVTDGSMNNVPINPVVIKRVSRLSRAEADWKLTD
jgi:cyclophilin family peptidyl-prolyl cis-trans isomerase